MRIWVVSQQRISKTSEDVPLAFSTQSEAQEFLTGLMRSFWEIQRRENDALGKCPEDWQQAQTLLNVLHDDGSWEWWFLEEVDLLGACAIASLPMEFETKIAKKDRLLYM